MRSPASRWLPRAPVYDPDTQAWDYVAGAELRKVGAQSHIYIGDRAWRASQAFGLAYGPARTHREARSGLLLPNSGAKDRPQRGTSTGLPLKGRTEEEPQSFVEQSSTQGHEKQPRIPPSSE